MKLYLVGLILYTVVCLVWGGALPTLGLTGTLYQVPGIGQRPLFVRNLHGVEGFQSDLYEIYMEPYAYDLHPIAAVAILTGSDAETAAQGELLFTQSHPPSGPVLIRGNITGLSPGKHGLHIHETGDLRKGCENIGEHFNPYHFQHGGPYDPLRHIGDLGNVEANAEGTANVTIKDGLLSLVGGARGVLGRAIAITADEDDLGRQGSADSITNGSSGKVLACGVIALIH